jgi:hypothetical protein
MPWPKPSNKVKVWWFQKKKKRLALSPPPSPKGDGVSFSVSVPDRRPSLHRHEARELNLQTLSDFLSFSQILRIHHCATFVLEDQSKCPLTKQQIFPNQTLPLTWSKLVVKLTSHHHGGGSSSRTKFKINLEK